MNVAKNILFTLISGLIFIGDKETKFIQKLSKQLASSRRPKVGREVVILSSKKKRFNYGPHLILEDLSRLTDQISFFFTKTILRVILFPFKVFLSVSLPPLKVFKRLRIRKKKKIPKRQFYKPSFLYKFKFFVMGSFFSFFFVFLPLTTFIFITDLPKPNTLSLNFISKTTKIYDRNEELLYEIYANQNRTVVRLEDINRYLKEATIAIEDKDFYTHPGFDLRGMARALVSDIRKQGFQGGSTITQQLVKSALLTPDPTIIRKVKEVVLAFWAERIYTKDEILSLYFNYVPYGGSAWGVESASEVYFGKKASDLSLSESAFLAGLPRAPSVYSPYSGQGNLWKDRQKEVLDAMVRTGYISRKQATDAYTQTLTFKGPQVPIKAPHFVMYVKDLLVQKYGLSEVERGGLQVKTTLDLSTQKVAEGIVAGEVDSDVYLNITNGASIVTNPKNGDILAMVGSRNYFDTEHDGNVNVTTSLRQPGSTIKIVTYSLALSSGFTEATILDDSPLSIYTPGAPTYTPVNYDGKFHGKISLRLAFANSLNIPAVRVAQRLGVENIVNFGKEMGISSWKSPDQYGLSITLGAGELKMTDLATVFGTVANQGKRVDLDPILEVKDANGVKIYDKNPVGKQVLDRGVAFIVGDILSDNNARSMEFGPNSPLVIPGRRISVKTGTTDNKRDNWTIGFTPDLLVATWVGNNNNMPMSPYLTSGITGAAPMWNKIMTKLVQEYNTDQVVVPDNIMQKPCLGRSAYFIIGTENSTSCVLPKLTPTPKPN